MEKVIARLVDDFVQGKMTRRQLVRRLSFAASAAAVGTSSAVAEGTGFKAFTVHHISYQCKDYRKTRDFYADLLGMKVTNDDGKQCYLRFGNQGARIIVRTARAGAPTPRIDHISYSIDPWDRNTVEAELKRRGLDPRPDSESFHVNDPDGYDLQINQKDMGPEK